MVCCHYILVKFIKTFRLLLVRTSYIYMCSTCTYISHVFYLYVHIICSLVRTSKCVLFIRTSPMWQLCVLLVTCKLYIHPTCVHMRSTCTYILHVFICTYISHVLYLYVRISHMCSTKDANTGNLANMVLCDVFALNWSIVTMQKIVAQICRNHIIIKHRKYIKMSSQLTSGFFSTFTL